MGFFILSLNHKLIKMKKIILILSFITLFSTNLSAQNQVYWSEVSMVVEPGNQGLVYQAVNDFYSSIDFPEGSSVSLHAINSKGEWREATHYLNFAGTVEGMAKLRELRSGDAYENYTNNLAQVAKIVSVVNGNSLIRIAGENGEFSTQEWAFQVDDAATFANAFVKLMENFNNDGMYFSLGQYNTGAGLSTHYIYTTHKDYAAEMTSGPKNEKDAAALSKFFETVNPISNYRGSTLSTSLASWSANN